jgi:hypothetical protein
VESVAVASKEAMPMGRTIDVASRGPSEFQSKAGGPARLSRSEWKVDREAIGNERAAVHDLQRNIAGRAVIFALGPNL